MNWDEESFTKELAKRGLRLRKNRNKRVLISLRYKSYAEGVLSMHEQLFDRAYPEFYQDVLDYAYPPKRRRGRRSQDKTGGPTSFEHMKGVLDDLFRQLNESYLSPLYPLFYKPIGCDFDFEQAYNAIYKIYFSDISKPRLLWSRQPAKKQLRSIRFGSYRSQMFEIRISPRLRASWMSETFVHHVLHHELCHHRQYVQPLKRREAMHSARFLNWEQEFEGFDFAKDWERKFLPLILDNRSS